MRLRKLNEINAWEHWGQSGDPKRESRNIHSIRGWSAKIGPNAPKPRPLWRGMTVQQRTKQWRSCLPGGRGFKSSRASAFVTAVLSRAHFFDRAEWFDLAPTDSNKIKAGSTE